MEEVTNLSQDDVLEVIKDFPLDPTRSRMIITVNTDEPEDGIDMTGNSFAEVQYVVAVGNFNQDIKAGQKVILDLKRMLAKDNSGQIEIDPIEVNGRMYAFINDGDIKCKDNR
jgi:hypothetical protein